MKFCKICGNIMDDDGDVCSQCSENEESSEVIRNINEVNRNISVVDRNRSVLDSNSSSIVDGDESSFVDKLLAMINLKDKDNRLSIYCIIGMIVTLFSINTDYFKISYEGESIYITLWNYDMDMLKKFDANLIANYFGTVYFFIATLIVCVLAWITRKELFYTMRKAFLIIDIMYASLCFLFHWYSVRKPFRIIKASTTGTVYAMMTILIPIILVVLQEIPNMKNTKVDYDRNVIENAFFLYKSGADTEKIGQAIGVRGELLKKVIEICETCSPEYDIDRGIKLWKCIDK